jgi:aminopeptidase N
MNNQHRWQDSFTMVDKRSVMKRDASPRIRPMTHYVEHPSQLRNLFDDIAYSKCMFKLTQKF